MTLSHRITTAIAVLFVAGGSLAAQSAAQTTTAADQQQPPAAAAATQAADPAPAAAPASVQPVSLAPFADGASVGAKQLSPSTPAPKTPLPDSVIQRPKTGFDVPVRDWLMKGTKTASSSGARGLRQWSRIVYDGFR